MEEITVVKDATFLVYWRERNQVLSEAINPLSGEKGRKKKKKDLLCFRRLQLCVRGCSQTFNMSYVNVRFHLFHLPQKPHLHPSPALCILPYHLYGDEYCIFLLRESYHICEEGDGHRLNFCPHGRRQASLEITAIVQLDSSSGVSSGHWFVPIWEQELHGNEGCSQRLSHGNKHTAAKN